MLELNFLDSDLSDKMMMISVANAEEVAAEEEVVDVTTEDHVAVIAGAVVDVVEEEVEISRSSMKMLSQLSEAVVLLAAAATKVNVKSLD